MSLRITMANLCTMEDAGEFLETLQNMRVYLDRLSAELRSVEQSREATSALNQELRNQLAAVAQQIRSVSADRDALERDRELLLAHLQRLSERVDQVSERVDQVSEHVHQSSGHLDHLFERVDRVERLVTGIFEGRIWRTLTFLASPLKVFMSRK